MIVGVTGGMGSGKSLVSTIFQDAGFFLLDADCMASRALDQGEHSYDQVVQFFGMNIVNKDATINRKKLAKIVFSDPSKLEKLNCIVHTDVRKRLLQTIEQKVKLGMNRFVYDCPLPVKHGFLDVVDTVVVVTASRSIRMERIKKRNESWSEKDISLRMDNQPSDKEYLELADYVIINDGSKQALIQKTSKIIRTLHTPKNHDC